VVAGIAAQRAIEITHYLGDDSGLPSQMPDDDDSRRVHVLQALWRQTRRGSPSAAKDLAQRLGIRDARSQGTEIGLAPDLEALLTGKADEDPPRST
jgi:hypothetical protein